MRRIDLSSKVQRYGLFAEMVIRTVYLVSKFVFKKVYYYFPKGMDSKLNPDYPTVYFANHVSETDIPGLANVHVLFQRPTIQYTIPVRQDMIEKNFLVKEFKPKGLAKYILHFIDLTGILPQLFKIVGAVGVKRPFRDNARALLKEGTLRDKVEEEWTILSKNIEKGKNVVIFPEGVFSEDGYLRPIKNGIAFLHEKKPDLKYFFFNFTYDYLSELKPVLHIGFGGTFTMPKEITREKVAIFIKEKLGSTFVMTPANILSWIVLNTDVYIGRTRKWLIDYCIYIANKCKEFMFVSEDLVNGNSIKALERILSFMLTRKVLKLNSHDLLQVGEDFQNEVEGKKHRKTIKERPFFYHKNQLRYFENNIYTIAKECISLVS